MKITITTPIAETPRVLQVRGLFDLPATTISQVEWDIDLPLHEKSWNVGLIVGPSGCGKTTVAQALWPTRPLTASWPTERCILDGFPEQTSIKELTEVLCSVGFASPTAWLRPFHVLSTGQQFRANLARLIATSALASEPRLPLVVDEFTSVVDRTVARLGSAALARHDPAPGAFSSSPFPVMRTLKHGSSPIGCSGPPSNSLPGGRFSDARRLTCESFAVDHRRGAYSHRITI